jgi:hypothetical protein
MMKWIAKLICWKCGKVSIQYIYDLIFFIHRGLSCYPNGTSTHSVVRCLGFEPHLPLASIYLAKKNFFIYTYPNPFSKHLFSLSLSHTHTRSTLVSTPPSLSLCLCSHAKKPKGFFMIESSPSCMNICLIK